VCEPGCSAWLSAIGPDCALLLSVARQQHRVVEPHELVEAVSITCKHGALRLRSAGASLTGNWETLAALLRHADGLLAFFGGHLFPDHFRVLAQGTVFGIAAQGEGEEAVGGRQVAGEAMSGRVEGAHGNHGLRVGLVGSGFYVVQTAFAVLWEAFTPIEVAFADDDRVGGL